VKAGDAILEVHYRDGSSLAAAMPVLRGAIAIGEVAPEPTPLVLDQIC
jgi:hypothetical protein